jgi:hypothetical protein
MFLTSLLIPFVTGLITKYTLHSFLKFLINLVVSTGAGLINVGLTADGTAVISKAALVTAAYTVVTSTLMYLSVYKPLDLNKSLVPEFGIGPGEPAG